MRLEGPHLGSHERRGKWAGVRCTRLAGRPLPSPEIHENGEWRLRGVAVVVVVVAVAVVVAEEEWEAPPRRMDLKTAATSMEGGRRNEEMGESVGTRRRTGRPVTTRDTDSASEKMRSRDASVVVLGGGGGVVVDVVDEGLLKDIRLLMILPMDDASFCV